MTWAGCISLHLGLGGRGSLGDTWLPSSAPALRPGVLCLHGGGRCARAQGQSFKESPLFTLVPPSVPTCRFCEVEFQGPLSIQEEWVRHLQRHILEMNFSKAEPLPEELPAPQAQTAASVEAP